MAIKTAKVKLKGISPLLMHKYPLDPIEAFEKKSKEEQAEYTAYRQPNGVLYIPGINIQRGLVSAASYSKGKGRSNLVKPAAACLMVKEEYVGLGTKEFTIDSRRAVNPATGGAIVRHRARLDQWSVTFHLDWDDTLLREKEVRQIVDDLCQRVGLLDFRPEKKGSFGRAIVVEWAVN